MPLAWSKLVAFRKAENARNTGLAMMIAAMFLAPCMDMIAKVVSGHISGAQVSMFRFGLQALFLGPVVIHVLGTKGLWSRNPPIGIVRGILVALAVTCFFTSLKWMPLADAIAIFFVEPLILTILSAIFLHEKVGLRRAGAVISGLIGAMIIIRPSFQLFGPASLLPLATALFFSIYLILTSKLAKDEHPLTMQFTAGWSAFVFLALLLGTASMGSVPLLTLVWPVGVEWGLLFMVGVIGTVAHLLIVFAFKHAPASLLAPFHYLEIVAASLLGLVVFGNFPDLLKWLGIVIIVISGMYVIWREADRSG